MHRAMVSLAAGSMRSSASSKSCISTEKGHGLSDLVMNSVRLAQLPLPPAWPART